MYLNMINFDPVDFSERRFEEVISLNWIFQITAFVIVGATQITEDQYISAG